MSASVTLNVAAVLGLPLVTCLLVSPALAVQFQTATTIGPVPKVGILTLVAVGPEDPDPASNADGAVHAVWRRRFNSSRTVLGDTTFSMDSARPGCYRMGEEVAS